MVVVSDSSPLNYLILIDAVQILPELFVQVVIPDGVHRELQNPGTPSKVAVWMRQPPGWIRIMNPAAPLEGEGIEKLGAGEREAIALCVQQGTEGLLLIDEGTGRREADRRQVRVMGILGVLDLAAGRGLIDLPDAIERLLQTTFYMKPVLLKMLLAADAQRKKSSQSPHR